MEEPTRTQTGEQPGAAPGPAANANWKKPFAIIYAGQLFSILGSSAVQFAIIWWLTVKTESAVTLTTASIVAFLPFIFPGPLAGVWVDRYNRRTVMMLADGLVALSSAVLGVVFLLNDSPPIPFIYAILFVRGLGSAFHSPAMQAAIPMLVPADKLVQAGGWGNMVASVSSMLGPVLGAALMAFAPISSIMLVDIAGAVFAIICLLFVKIPSLPQSGEKAHIFTDMKHGVRAILANKPLASAFFPVMLVNVLYMPLGSLYPLLVRVHFHGTATAASITELTFAAGLLISSIIIGIFGGIKKRFLMISLSIASLGIFSTLGGLLPPGAIGVFFVASFFMGACGTFMQVPLMAYVQESIAPEVMGKVMSFFMTAMSLAMPVGLVLAGPLSEKIGVDNWFFYSGIALAAVSILFYAVTAKYDPKRSAATASIDETAP